MDLDNIFTEQSRKNAEGTLTVGEALINCYYRLLEGKSAGRVIIKTCAKIDNKSVAFFANGLTWKYIEDLKDVRCERVYPTFNQAQHHIDRSQATWYNDNSSTPQHYEW